jgi:hypothetical protein
MTALEREEEKKKDKIKAEKGMGKSSYGRQ